LYQKTGAPAAQSVYLLRIALLAYTGAVNGFCVLMRATGHADHPRAADLGEQRPDDARCE
jgi:hypothetical protein